MIATRDLVRRFGPLVAVDGVTITARRGETLAVVGESGSGKSTLARLMVGLIAPSAGAVLLDGRPLADWPARERQRKVQMLFQNPQGSLNPRRRIGAALAEPLRRLHGLSAKAAAGRAAELLERVQLPPELLDRHPHALSGGQAQRVALARALAAEPELLILDEPTSALDALVQARVLDLLAELKAGLGLTYVLITHDLAVVRRVADRVAVMRRGEVVEEGAVAEVYARPRHPYTRLLLDSLPVPGRRMLDAIPDGVD